MENSFTDKSEGSRLRELRLFAGLTIQRSAAWLNVSTAHLSNVERGVARLTCEERAAIESFYLKTIVERGERIKECLAGEGS